MEWRSVKPLKQEDLVAEYEEKVGYHFPADFKAFVQRNNGARPPNKIFLSWHGKRKRQRVFDVLCSFNKDDIVTIWDYSDCWKGRLKEWNEDGRMENYIVFAGDPFGNLICFDKTNDSIIWIDHETLNIEFVANSFMEFINSLRKS